MDYSEDEDNKIQEEVDAFKSIIPSRPKNRLGGHGRLQIEKSAVQVRNNCKRLMDEILQERIKELCEKIFATVRENWTGKNSIVFALNLKRNQKNDLPKIVDKIQSIQKEKGTAQQKIMTWSVHEIRKEDVRDIALQIQINQDQLFDNATISTNQQRDKLHDADGQRIDLNKHINIYVTRRMTNLCQQNIHVFQNTVINAKYVVILPTFESLKIVDGQGIIEESQKYFFQAYNSKELFIEFFYRSIVSRHIMAYLPKQILGLIKMYDYYPISYQEGCNMLMYAVQLFNAKCEQKGKPKKKLVEMKELIRTFNKTWKFIWNNESEVNRYNFQILSHCILDESAQYKISEKKILNYIKLNQAKDSGIEVLEEKNVYETFEKTFKEKLSTSADENFKLLAKVLEDFDKNRGNNQAIKMKKKNAASRELGLGFTSKIMKDQKHYFQQKITKLFKVATADVRRQAQYVEWNELKIFETMCPQILKDTVDGIMQDAEFRDVFNMIRSHSSYPMARLIKSFEKIEIGRLVYILRCLELKGLIELNKNTLKPSLMTNFYDKSVYRMAAES